MNDCIFCKIAAKEIPARIVWEDAHYMAFLNMHPNTEGFTVVITKDHHDSYAFDLPDDVLTGLVLAAKKVGKILDSAFEDVGRTGLMFEGFGVDHIHAKLFPMHGTKAENWQVRNTQVDTYFDVYQGYMSSHDAGLADDATLDATAAKIRKSAQN
ncbi:MAG: HIT family protein [Candidatus Saccharibacteria bacterium]